MNKKKYKIYIVNQNTNNSLYFSHLEHDENAQLAIEYKNNKHQIFQRHIKPKNYIWIELNSKSMHHRTKHINKEAIKQAVGIKKKNNFPNIIDATAGLGKDALILASLGCRVLMLEKNPIIAILLSESLNRIFEKKTTLNNIKNRLSLIYTSNYIFLKKTKIKPDIIYLDPMFPIKNKKSKSKKDVQMLKTIVNIEKQNNMSLNLARSLVKNRVIVKRPQNAPFLDNMNASYIIKTKKYRFDIYLHINNFKKK